MNYVARTSGLMRLIGGLLLVVLLPGVQLRSQPVAGFLETAVIPSFPQKRPDADVFQTFFRKDLDETHRLVVVRGRRSHREGWGLPHTSFFLQEGDLLGLFLMSRKDSNLAWELGVFEIGKRADLMWVDRVDRNSIVFGRLSGDYGIPAPYWKFEFDVSAKRLLGEFEYDPIRFVRFVRTGDALLALGFTSQGPVVIGLGKEVPRMLDGGERERLLASLPAAAADPNQPPIPPVFKPWRAEIAGAAPTECLDLPDTDRFCLQVTTEGQRWVTGVVERQGQRQKFHPLPQSTPEEYAAARPGSLNVVTQENIDENFGPYQMADRFWFGKGFYDGEGTTGVGGIGFFDSRQGKYVVHSPPELAPWSTSALLVEDNAVWAGLIRHPEGGHVAGGLLRLDRPSLSTHVYSIPDVITAIARGPEGLLIATLNGAYRLRGDKLDRFTVEPNTEGAHELWKSMPEQVRSGMSYPESVLAAELSRGGRSAVESACKNLPAYGPEFVLRVLGAHCIPKVRDSMMPVLIRLLDDPPARLRDSRVRQAALRRLIEIAPQEGKSRLISELRRLSPVLDSQLLRLLPPESVPPMNDTLIAHLERWRKNPADGFNAPLLAARYLSANARQRVRAVYESQPDPCQPEMIAYFLRADPAYASEILKRDEWEMHQPVGPCVMIFIRRVPWLRMTAQLEEFLEAYLWHEQVPVKAAAAISLGQYGSPAAQEALWKAFRYFHEYWKDQTEKMTAASQAAWLEEQIRNSIARAGNWIAGREALLELGSLCLGDRCKDGNSRDLSFWNGEPLPLTIVANSELDFTASVAQYGRLGSLQDLLEKLAQFPKGTVFRLSVTGKEPRARTEMLDKRVREAVARAGCLIE